MTIYQNMVFVDVEMAILLNKINANCPSGFIEDEYKRTCDSGCQVENC